MLVKRLWYTCSLAPCNKHRQREHFETGNLELHSEGRGSIWNTPWQNASCAGMRQQDMNKPRM